MAEFMLDRKAAIPKVLREAAEPLTLDELQAAVEPLVVGSVTAKSLKSTVYALKRDSVSVQRTADGHYAWLPNLLTGVRLRHLLHAEEFAYQVLILDIDTLMAFWPEFWSYRVDQKDPLPDWTVTLPNGGRIAWQLESVILDENQLWGVPAEPALWTWLAESGAEQDDSLLLEITDSPRRQARLWLERDEDEDAEKINEANELLEHTAYALCKRRRTLVPRAELAAQLLTQGLYHTSCPPDPLTIVLEMSDRFLFDWQGRVKVANRYDKLYADLGSDPWTRFSFEATEDTEELEETASELSEDVYRFKIAFRRRKGLWRRIDVRGDQTLKEFDDEIRQAFGHDLGDHLSEFYLGTDAEACRRGLGAIYPFGGEGDGEDWLVGELGLEPGDELSFTYDFGDNIQHVLTLEAVSPVNVEMTFPRVVAQSKPRYRYCQRCREQGKKEIATWACVDCSNRQGRSVLVCETCLEAEHEGHRAKETVY